MIQELKANTRSVSSSAFAHQSNSDDVGGKPQNTSLS